METEIAPATPVFPPQPHSVEPVKRRWTRRGYSLKWLKEHRSGYRFEFPIPDYLDKSDVARRLEEALVRDGIIQGYRNDLNAFARMEEETVNQVADYLIQLQNDYIKDTSICAHAIARWKKIRRQLYSTYAMAKASNTSYLRVKRTQIRRTLERRLTNRRILLSNRIVQEMIRDWSVNKFRQQHQVEPRNSGKANIISNQIKIHEIEKEQDGTL